MSNTKNLTLQLPLLEERERYFIPLMDILFFQFGIFSLMNLTSPSFSLSWRRGSGALYL
jgi:hypothetical protein